MGRTAPAARPPWSGWFRHSSMVLLEAVLVLGWLEELAQGALLTRTEVPPFARVAAAMALSLTLLGGVALMVQRQIVAGLRTTHRMTRGVPKLVAHILVLAAIFVAYAWLWDDETGALSTLVGLIPKPG